MDFLWCSCKTCWCCGLCAAFVHPVEDHDAQTSLQNTPAPECGGLLAGSNVAVSFPAALCPPRELSFEGRGSGVCQKLEPSQSSIELIYQPDDGNGPQQDTAVESEKSKLETDEATIKFQKLGEIENDLKECTLASLADDDDICSTCLDGYDSENPKIITACGHHFHLGCILEWAERRPTCPVCDKEMNFVESL